MALQIIFTAITNLIEKIIEVADDIIEDAIIAQDRKSVV